MIRFTRKLRSNHSAIPSLHSKWKSIIITIIKRSSPVIKTLHTPHTRRLIIGRRIWFIGVLCSRSRRCCLSIIWVKTPPIHRHMCCNYNICVYIDINNQQTHTHTHNFMMLCLVCAYSYYDLLRVFMLHSSMWAIHFLCENWEHTHTHQK